MTLKYISGIPWHYILPCRDNKLVAKESWFGFGYSLLLILNTESRFLQYYFNIRDEFMRNSSAIN